MYPYCSIEQHDLEQCTTLASLGVTPGTYVCGDRANQRFTLLIRAAGVPDSGSTVSLLGCALVGLAAFRRKLRC